MIYKDSMSNIIEKLNDIVISLHLIEETSAWDMLREVRQELRIVMIRLRKLTDKGRIIKVNHKH